MSRVLLLTLIVLQTACGTLYPAIKVETAGAVNPAADAEVAKRAKKIEDPQVTVVQGSIPEGLDLQEVNNKVVVLPGAEARYEILGVVEADYTAVKNAGLKNWLWTWSDYKSTGKQVYCYTQAPLKAVTLGIYGWMPWTYPCTRYAPNDESKRASALVNEMKRGAAAMGGNLVLLTGSGDLEITVVDKYGSSTSHVGTIKMRGFVIKDKGGPSAPPSEASPAPASPASAQGPEPS